MDNPSQSTDIIEKLVCAGCTGEELNKRADHYRRRELWDDALEFARLSLDLCKEGSHMQSVGIAQMHLGAIFHAKGSLREAAGFYESSLDSFVYDRRNRSISWLAIARIKRQLGEWRSVVEAYEFSLEILKGLDQELYEEISEEYQEVVRSRPPKTLPVIPQSEGGGKEIPIVARIAAGEPILAEENIDGYTHADKETATQVDYALRVRGDSMIEDNIQDGDLVLMQRRVDPPPRGRIVAAIVTQMDDEATLKRFHDEGDHIRLEPANGTHPFLIVIPDAHLEEDIHARYRESHPDRALQCYPGAEVEIRGWAKALIREEVK
jgi:SOS-response transcriptional repressor LexA